MTVANTPPLTISIGADAVIEVSPVTPVNISAYTLTAYLCQNAGSLPIYTLTVNNGITFDVTNGADGVFYVSLTRAQTGLLNTGTYFLGIWQTGGFPSNDPLATTLINMTNSGRPFP
jgi:hypothetical protein